MKLTKRTKRTKRTLRLTLIVIVALAALCLACGPGGEWVEWNSDINRRQKENHIPVPELDNLSGDVVAQPVGVVACSFAWGG